MTLPIQDPIRLSLLPERFAVCRLQPDEPVPDWGLSLRASLVSLTRTATELSLVVPEGVVPAGMPSEIGWCAFVVVGTLDFGLVGVLAGLTTVLARATIPVFVLSTFDTDYILVKEVRVNQAISALSAAGYKCDIELR